MVVGDVKGPKLTLHKKVADQGWLNKGKLEEEEKSLHATVGRKWWSSLVVRSSSGVVEVLNG